MCSMCKPGTGLHFPPASQAHCILTSSPGNLSGSGPYLCDVRCKRHVHTQHIYMSLINAPAAPTATVPTTPATLQVKKVLGDTAVTDQCAEAWKKVLSIVKGIAEECYKRRDDALKESAGKGAAAPGGSPAAGSPAK